MASGYDISASSSQTATSGAKVATGPVQFAPVTVTQGGNPITAWLLIGGAVLLLLFLLNRKS